MTRAMSDTELMELHQWVTGRDSRTALTAAALKQLEEFEEKWITIRYNTPAEVLRWRRSMLLHQIVEENGKTIKENNLARTHTYPVGSLVETEEGLRLWVSHCGRDCDGTPLYWLSFEKELDQASLYERCKQTGGHSEESLELIR